MRALSDLQPQQLLFAAAPGSDQSPELSEYIIISLGVFLGNIAMGVCGFGTAIIHLTVWVLAQALGYNSGPLPQAVIACSCAMTIGMVPLFFLAKARQHAIKPLAISIPIFKGLAAPFGALVLKLLPVRQLEAVVSVLMVVMMILINRQKLQAALVHMWSSQLGTSAGPGCPAKQISKAEHIRITREAWLDQGYDHSDDPLTLNQGVQHVGSGDISKVGVCKRTCTADEDADTDSDDSSSSSSSSCFSENEDVHQPLLVAQLQLDEDVTILVQGSDTASDGSSGNQSAAARTLAEADSSAFSHIGFWRLFAIGSVTGLCTGVLGGATGIAGPPMMIMYAYLQASKEAVRGTNAVMSLVQDQWIGYYAFGLLHWTDLHLYLAAAVAGALGMLIGNSVQKLMDQRHFNAVMSVLMGTCCVLMCSAAAGWISLSG